VSKRSNSRNPALVAVLACAVASLAGCAAVTTETRAAPAILADIPHEADAAGDRVVVVRDYVELQKIDDRDQRRRVQYVWNYDRGITQRRVWDEAGTRYEVTDFTGMTLNATPEELAWMWKTLRADPRWSSVLVDGLDYYGGFSVREPTGPCQARSRCVHAIVMRDDGRERVLHGIFDLASGRLVDDDYDPTLTGIGQRKTSSGEKKP
jgi:hypothetical protein